MHGAPRLAADGQERLDSRPARSPHTGASRRRLLARFGFCWILVHSRSPWGSDDLSLGSGNFPHNQPSSSLGSHRYKLEIVSLAKAAHWMADNLEANVVYNADGSLKEKPHWTLPSLKDRRKPSSR